MSNQQTRKRPSLTTWILISLVAGIVVGLLISAVSPEGSPFDQYVTEGLFYVLGQWFIRLMQMLVIPLVFCSIVCGAAAMADPKLLGKVGIGTLLMYIITTALAVLIAIGLAQLVAPGVGLDLASVIMADTTTASTEVSMAETLINIIPTNIIEAMNNGAMLQIIFFALILGFVLGRFGSKAETVNRFFEQFNTVMMTMIDIMLKVAPIGIFCLIARTFANLGITGMMPMLKFILTVYGGLFIQLFIVYAIIFVLFTRLNPFWFLRKMLPVILFAFSTSSSNATIPLNLETLERKCGVDEKVASFTIPLGATINMSGTAIMQGVAVVFVAQAFGIDLSTSALMTVVITAVTAAIGTAGVPGVGTIMLAMVFESVGLPAAGIAMIMGVDRILDMGRTAVNVTGDAVVTMCMASLTKTLDRNVFQSRNEDLIEEPVKAPSE